MTRRSAPRPGAGAARRLRDLAELVRAPAALTVPGDVLAGAAAAGRSPGLPVAGLAASSVCLYWAGMALNDWADRDLDAVERPERPIPSGRVTAPVALSTAVGLTAAALGLAAAAEGRRAMTVGVPLAATVWAYDLWAKPRAAGPAVMAAARGLDVLLGAGVGRTRPALPAAATIAGHTLAVTALSRAEVSGADPWLPGAALAATGAVTAAVALRGARAAGAAGAAGTMRAGQRAGRAARPAVACGLAAYGATAGLAQARAVADPSPGRVRGAVGAGILGLIPLQAALAASAGARRPALALAAVFAPARALSRRVSPT
ncbi:SCO3242 family prenyltransferase [Streptomyces sp. NRRL F-5126]|uniref:SCO3242 family prenyltransferase n=1 Tax=Streptomyces sp. NRRL F-5126 TaxID=1463857 RepID=UPI00068F3999|nr:UbiA family prenyltransferase [Streptomyces sp. NRRL F-5126]